MCEREGEREGGRRTVELVPPLRRDMLVVFFVFFFRGVPLRLFVPVVVVVVVCVSVCVVVQGFSKKERTQRLSHLAVPTILNRILTTTRQGLADLTPTISEFRLKFHYNCILLRCPFAFSQRTVQMIEPSFSALLTDTSR